MEETDLLQQDQIQLEIDVISTFSLAAQQNAYSVIRNIQVFVPENNQSIYRDLKLKLCGIDGWLGKVEWLIDEVTSGQSVRLPIKELKFPFETLFGLTEEMVLQLDFELIDSEDKIICNKTHKVSVLPSNFWGGETRQPDLLAAFVKPNGLYVESLVRKVASVLETGGHGRSVDGYQSNTREKPYLMLAALWNVIFQEKLAYVSPPQGFAKTGQRIRLAADISQSKMTACLDSSILFASCIEAMGLNPVIAITQGHAFAGAWLIDEKLPVLCNDDPQDIRKRFDNRDLVLFETTLVTNASTVTFEQAKEYARNLLGEDKEEEFVMVLDIAQARSQSIKPLSTIEEARIESESTSESIELVLPEIPPLPPVRAEERIVEDSPETRIDSWCRKLLDLTKRNRLLNFNDRSVSIKLYCPDIANMEDMLADGTKFKFLSTQESPYFDSDRDSELFRFQTGSEIHKEYALNQLKNKILLANQPPKRVEKSAIELFRKAKNDLEESGSNTLFLALGFLKWKENADDSRSFKAPLILIPVNLTRKSARAPIYVEQVQGEDPIFNLTLIEFLLSEHDINLNEFKDGLPEDESGIDVPLIWHKVRQAVSEQQGFEVVEELVLSSFSFAKYLMWKDLRDRLEVLKENQFVQHLVDNPKEAYIQTAEFVEQHKVDDAIDPAEVFTPLNCDSSQLVAVDASAKEQDFVLEGPPGTGKSETIANIIAHNIGKGRKVLFVAEKMAALNVVYKRLQKVGLDHLCLELHSNKANKKTVLDQLGQAWQFREGLNPETWAMHISDLKDKKDKLNDYVRELHKKSKSDISVRDAISKLALSKDNIKFSLDWPLELGADKTLENDYSTLKGAVLQLKIAFEDIYDLDITSFLYVNASSWSNVWQSQLTQRIDEWDSQFENISDRFKSTLDILELKLPEMRGKSLSALSSLHKLKEFAKSRNILFVLKSGLNERLKLIEDIALRKEKLDELISKQDDSIKIELLLTAPIREWHSEYKAADNSWFRTFFAKWKINQQVKDSGFQKFKHLSILSELLQAKDLAEAISKDVTELENLDIWKGWTTTSEELIATAKFGRLVKARLNEVFLLTDDPANILVLINKHFVDGRDYLDSSLLVSKLDEFDSTYIEFEKVQKDLFDSGITVPFDSDLTEISKSLANVRGNQAKLKSWCEWINAKDIASNIGLSTVEQALSSGVVSSSELLEQFELAYYSWLAPLMIDESQVLREFKASTHEATIDAFCKLDEKVAKITSEYIIALASSRVPSKEIKDSKNDQRFGVLAKEIQKKTRHIPIRALINELGESLLELTPCMMMSPLSVAQFLPADFKGFDLVVFDEASQMTTWDSVGSIARGRNVIIVGDPKQMPPTNFFSAGTSDAPDEEDLESILDQALAARLPLKRLMGHYRSKHETLIAFSNSKYYENSLVTYPSSETKESAVSLHKVNGLYAKGKGRNNVKEAQAVVNEITRRLLDKQLQNYSIGVVTLNSEQQRTIEDLLDEARRNNPDIERFFHESETSDSVFVKNLESVQGDERDIIMLSLGYGPTEPEAKTMSMNFGPLNKQGGERRLNVAITRATTEVIVFSSFSSSMIDLSRTSSTAIEHLKHYLEFAERGPVALAETVRAEHGVDQFDSDFEQAVANDLRQLGWKVQTQVGVSKFRVDLGILHPDKPGCYITGVECDGATYHSSPAARDRDRVRQIILESLGWNIVRLWSTDYFVDAETAIKKLDLKLNEILELEREKDRLLKVEVEAEPEAEIKAETEADSVMTHKDYEHNALEQDTLSNQSVLSRGVPLLASDEFDANNYFKPEYKARLEKLAKETLRERPGITLHTLALEIANLHGLTRTSKKQVDYIRELITPWAGIKDNAGYSPTVWFSPEDTCELINWRGVNAFGYERNWKELAYEEALGLAIHAKSANVENPVEEMCSELGLKRKHETTIRQFETWLSLVK